MGPIGGGRAQEWARREAEAGREMGKTREALREVTRDEDREHVHQGGEDGKCGRVQDRRLSPGPWGPPESPEVTTINSESARGLLSSVHSVCRGDAYGWLTPGPEGLEPGEPICPRLLGRESGVGWRPLLSVLSPRWPSRSQVSPDGQLGGRVGKGGPVAMSPAPQRAWPPPRGYLKKGR